MNKIEESRVTLLKFQGKRRTYFLRPGVTRGSEIF